MDIIQATDYLCTDEAKSVHNHTISHLHPVVSLIQGATAVELQKGVHGRNLTASAVLPGVKQLDGERCPLNAPHGLHLRKRLTTQHLDLQCCQSSSSLSLYLVDSAIATTAHFFHSNYTSVFLCRFTKAGGRKSCNNVTHYSSFLFLLFGHS